MKERRELPQGMSRKMSRKCLEIRECLEKYLFPGMSRLGNPSEWM